MNDSCKCFYRGKLKAVIFDWAGTTVDFGCFAPTSVFTEVFRKKGIEITVQEARGPMGINKRDHITAISHYPRIRNEWKARYGQECTYYDIEEMYQNFIELQLSVIDQHSAIIPELPEALRVIRSMGMKIGSTTGYNAEVMKILINSAAQQGFTPDAVVCSSEVKTGRPAPWMALRNAEILDIYPMQAIVKIGDTVADIQEGVNAGMWSVGVVLSCNQMGLSQEEISRLDQKELSCMKTYIRNSFLNAGADYVIDSLAEVYDLFDKINMELDCGERP